MEGELMSSSSPIVAEYKKDAARAFERGKRIFGRSAERANDVAREAGVALEDLREEARHELHETRRTIQKNPLLSVGIGVAAGAVLGAALGYAISKVDWSCSEVEERFI
jgi:ElaB/YqjD/DUF883 family membrane-anchored ribosome-binding protein